MDQGVIQAKGISKSFGKVQALLDVDFALRDNEVVALLGNNGSGKSTLIKIIIGFHQPDAGEIFVRGEKRNFQSPKDALGAGIATVYQNLALVDDLSVTKNMYLARFMKRKIGNVVPINDWRSMREQAAAIIQDRLGLDIDPTTKVEYLSGGERQAIAIGRALITDPDILIMDEPTSALSPTATQDVLNLIRELKQEGLAIIVISHNIPDVYSVADRYTVLLNGKRVGSVEKASVAEDDIKEMMISGKIPEGVEEAELNLPLHQV